MDMVIKEHSAVLKLTTLTLFQAAGWMKEGNCKLCDILLLILAGLKTN